ncbi:hypothetical protein ACCO45_011023 [Purpureocillium lilacinum]|uniref:Uncharacterized protein n=1 Tax=Purpureocillium lilacinum TaxID=33203 RepID=A0ACC4DJG3_PURLI
MPSHLAARLTAAFGEPVEDPDEETFLLYARPMPSQDLGFVDPRAAVLEVPVRGRDYTIHQSPSVLASSRAGGTTGAGAPLAGDPLFASWLAGSDNNPILPLLRPRPSVVELGCGISPLCALALRPLVSSYLLTDQPYVQRLVAQNLAANPPPASSSSFSSPPTPPLTPLLHLLTSPPRRQNEQHAVEAQARQQGQSSSSTAIPHGTSFDAVLACDCVFNYALVAPFVQTCADVCALRASESRVATSSSSSDDNGRGHHSRPGDAGEDAADPCLCIVAQQLRNDDVFLEWLRAFSDKFRVWRVPEDVLPEGLRPDDGFVVHVGVLKEDHEQQ